MDDAPRTRTDEVLEVLRHPAPPDDLFRGFGPLVVAVLLALLVIALLPSIAPEEIIEAPAGTATSVQDGAG